MCGRRSLEGLIWHCRSKKSINSVKLSNVSKKCHVVKKVKRKSSVKAKQITISSGRDDLQHLQQLLVAIELLLGEGQGRRWGRGGTTLARNGSVQQQLCRQSVQLARVTNERGEGGEEKNYIDHYTVNLDP